MHEVREGRVAKVAVTCGCRGGEGADATLHVLLDAVYPGLEVSHHPFVDFLLAHIDDLALDILLDQLVALERQVNSGLGHVQAVARGIDAEHVLALRILQHHIMHHVVVAEEDGIKALHLLCHSLGGVFLHIVLHRDATIKAAVEEADDDVRTLHLLDVLHPSARAAHHLLKLQALPQALVEPAGDGWRQHAKDGYLHALALDHGIGTDIRQPSRCVDDVRTQHRAVHLAYPFVVDLMARLHIVIAHCLSIIAQVVHHAGSQVLFLRHDIVRPVHAGLSLQDVAIVDEQHTVAILLALALHIGAHPGEGAFQGLALDEVVREETSMNITGLDDLQADVFCLAHSWRCAQAQHGSEGCR